MLIGSVINRGALTTFHNAIRHRNSEAARIIVMGDSISEGVIAGGYQYRWQQLLQDKLRAKYPLLTGSMGAGYIPALTVTGSPTPPVVTSGSPGTGFIDQGLGIKRYRVNSSQYVEWTAQTFDKVRIWYGKSDTLSGEGVVSIDGVDQTPRPSSIATANADGFYTDYSVAAGSHTVRVRGFSTFGFVLEGAEFYNGDEHKGIRVYDGAHSGATTGTYLGTGPKTYGHWQVVNALGAIGVDLFIVNLGVNDWGAYSATTYLSQIDQILALIETAANGRPHAVLLVGNYRPVKASNPDPAIWDAYQAGLRARATGNVAYFSIQPPWPDLFANTPNEYIFETIAPLHPNQAGHALFADLIYQAIRIPTYLPGNVDVVSSGKVRPITLPTGSVENTASNDSTASTTTETTTTLVTAEQQIRSIELPRGLYPLKSSAWDIDEYRIKAGWPVPIPKCDIRAITLASASGALIGNRDVPTALLTNAELRWVADADLYNETTLQWVPLQGSDPVWQTSVEYAPTLVTNYEYRIDDERFVEMSALNFDSDTMNHMWANFSYTFGGSAGYTVIMVMSPNSVYGNDLDVPYNGLWCPGDATPTGQTFTEDTGEHWVSATIQGKYLYVETDEVARTRVLSLSQQLSSSAPTYVAMVFTRPQAVVYVATGPNSIQSKNVVTGAAPVPVNGKIVLGRSTGDVLHTADMALFDLGMYANPLTPAEVQREFALLSRVYGGAT